MHDGRLVARGKRYYSVLSLKSPPSKETDDAKMSRLNHDCLDYMQGIGADICLPCLRYHKRLPLPRVIPR